MMRAVTAGAERATGDVEDAAAATAAEDRGTTSLELEALRAGTDAEPDHPHWLLPTTLQQYVSSTDVIVTIVTLVADRLASVQV